MKYYLTVARLIIIKKKYREIESVVKRMEKSEHMYIAGGSVDWYKYYGKYCTNS
jgi:hypothetical protein